MNNTKKSMDLVKHHLAVFETTIRLEDKDHEIEYEREYLASCVTFTPEGKVPAGKKYNVTINNSKMYKNNSYI